MDHHFGKREYATSCTVTFFFVALISTAYVDISTCPYDSNGGYNAHGKPLESVFSPDFSIVPCHMIDLVVWSYIVWLVVFVFWKFWVYRSQGLHYFLLDYCYFHNACLTGLFLRILVRVRWSSTPFVVFGGGELSLPDGLDVVPVATAVGALGESLDLSVLAFFGLLSGSFGPILGAVLMWRNAMLFHSFDKMTSCYLHLAPGVTQALLLHSALSSIRLRGPESRLRKLLRANVSYTTLLVLHVCMFAAWQLVYHLVNEMRRKQRLRKLARMSVISQACANVERVTAYTYLMEHPPLGKEGPLFRFVTILGRDEVSTKFMFSVAQLLIHFLFFSMSYPPLFFSLVVVESALPMFAYTWFFFFVCIYNAAAVNKSWIRKLQQREPSAPEESAKDNRN
jgi:hypothetical protein